MQATSSGATNRLSFELKYCERCGGLWLRPTGGDQIYCVPCGRAMDELPQRLRHPGAAVERKKAPREEEIAGAENYAENDESLGDNNREMDAAGGTA